MRSRITQTRRPHQAVAALEHHAGRRAAEEEQEHTESRARFAARIYFSHPPPGNKLYSIWRERGKEGKDIVLAARTCAPVGDGCWGPGVLGFMQASFFCPGRAQDIRTGPPMAPLSIGLTHLTLLEERRMHAPSISPCSGRGLGGQIRQLGITVSCRKLPS
jgi:hypothetical protein